MAYFKLLLKVFSLNLHVTVATGVPAFCSVHINVALDPFSTEEVGLEAVMIGGIPRTNRRNL